METRFTTTLFLATALTAISFPAFADRVANYPAMSTPYDPATMTYCQSDTTAYSCTVGGILAGGSQAAFSTLTMLYNPSLTVMPLGNTLTTLSSTNVVANSVSSTTREFHTMEGFVMNTGSAGPSTGIDDKVGQYVGAICESGAKNCWSSNHLMTLSSPLNANFSNAFTTEFDFNNSSGQDFDAVYGALPTYTHGYAGNLNITGGGPNNAGFAINIGGTNTVTHAGYYNRGIEFQNGLGASLADIQSDDQSEAVFADFGAHTFGIDLEGTYFGNYGIKQQSNNPGWLLSSALAGQERSIWSATANSIRWRILMGDSTAESGGNAGSDFRICNYTGGGVGIGCPIFLQRSTGSMTFSSPPILPGFTVAGLPAGVTGMIAYVSDQLTACPALGGTFTGGGSVKCRAWYNGTAWVED